jgi:uncharacterized protein (TIGR02996 family)
MAVHFVYRCGYVAPRSLYHRRFDEDDSVLDWFRRHWRRLPREEVWAHVERLLGVEVAYFGGIFSPLEGELPPPPQSMEDVAASVEGTYHNAVCFEDHCLQVLTDDDEIDMAYLFFDDHFLAEHGGLAAYVIRDDWRLPDGEGESWSPKEQTRPEDAHGEGPGCLYLARLELHSGEVLCDGFSPAHVGGVRIPDLCRWLMGLEQPDPDSCDYSLLELRRVLLDEDLGETDEERSFLAALRAAPDDDLNWGVYSDWLQEHGLHGAGRRLLERALPRVNGGGDPARNLCQVGDHVAQLFAHAGDEHRFDHWFLFDDLWGGAHPVLAEALLRYANRWDVLSTGRETRWD